MARSLYLRKLPSALYCGAMENYPIQNLTKSRPHNSIDDTLCFAADQMAEIIYETIRLREMRKAEGETKSSSTFSSHT